MTPVVPDTVSALLQHRAATDGHRIAVVGNDGTGEYRQWTYAELDTVVSSVADLLSATLRMSGTVPKQARVVWAYSNASGALALVLYHAILRAGAVNVPVNPSQTRAEMRNLTARVAPALVLAPSAELADDIDEHAPRLLLCSVDDVVAAAARAADADADRTQPVSGDPAVVLFTSGTTGRSKGVVHSHSSALAAGRGWRHAFQLSPQDVYQSTFPVFSGAGLHFNALACLLAGCAYVIDEPRPTSTSLQRVHERRSTVYAAVPAVYEFWLAELAHRDHDLTSLRLLDFGGAVMRRDTITALRQAFPDVDLVQTYGLTEAGPGGLHLPARFVETHLGSIGVIATGDLEVRVDTSVVGGGQDGDEAVGELLVAGSSVMSGYFDDDAATDAVLKDGWLRTGDLVKRDAAGVFYLLDRIKDLVLRGGQNISTVELEEVFLQYQGIREAAAFGMPHDRLGESVAAAIVPTDANSFDVVGFKGFVERTVSRHKVPSYLVLLPSLPYSSAGKVLKHSLRNVDGLAPW